MSTTITRPKIGFHSLLVLLLVAVFCSCQKEMSFETGNSGGSGGVSGGSAVFALVPSVASCSDAVVSGAYQAGTALGTDAQIVLTVNVTKAGDWTYTTGTVNGYSFTGAGSFAAAGTQSITLYGTGTPAAAGTNEFPLNIGGATCKTSVTVVPASTPVTGSDFYYKATIGGVNYSQAVTATNDFEAGSGLNGVNDVSFVAGIDYGGTGQPPAGSTSMGVEKGLMHGYLSATNAAFKAFFPIGDVPYAKPGVGSFSNGDGVILGWSDPSGNSWDTQSGTGDQTGSTFKIVSITEKTDITGTYYLVVKMQFSCKLYNHTTGIMKQLTNGEMVSIFAKI